MRWSWPDGREELERVQRELAEAAEHVPAWEPAGSPVVGGVFFAAPTGSPGRRGERAWAAAVALAPRRPTLDAVVRGTAAAPYVPGLLALREGRLLERAVRALREAPDVLLVNATGRDHPRRAGLALHLGAVLDLPTIGVTDRPLLAGAAEPGPERGDRAPLLLEGERVGAVVRTRRRARPLVVHAAWRTGPDAAVRIVLSVCSGARTPEPLRAARRLARVARAVDEGRLPATEAGGMTDAGPDGPGPAVRPPGEPRG